MRRDDEADAARALVRWSCESLACPDAPSQRIYDRAKREQWSIDRDVPGIALQLGSVPRTIRGAMAAVYAQVQYGEMLALTSAARFVDVTPEGWARLFGATQVMDEARHVEFFARAVSSLDASPRLSPYLVEFGECLKAADSVAELLVQTQLVLEGFAQAVLMEGAALARRAEARAIALPGSDSIAAFRRALTEYVARDEARHVAFGVVCLKRWLAERDPSARRRIERNTNERFALLLSTLVDLRPHLSLLGLNADELAARISRATWNRLREVGIELDFPSEPERPAVRP